MVFQLTNAVWNKLTKAINTNLENIKSNFRVKDFRLKWDVSYTGDICHMLQQRIMIIFLLIIKNFNSVPIPRWVPTILNKKYPIRLFERVFLLISIIKLVWYPFKFVEGIIFDDNDSASSPESSSGFDLVMSLGSTVEDTGLDLMRGNNESSDEENRRLRKLNQEGLTTFKNFRSIEMNFF